MWCFLNKSLMLFFVVSDAFERKKSGPITSCACRTHSECILRTIYFYFFTFGRYWRLCRRLEDVTSFSTCWSFFCVRLITNTYCECTRDARCKSEVSRKKSVSRPKKSPEKNVGVVPSMYFVLSFIYNKTWNKPNKQVRLIQHHGNSSLQQDRKRGM